MPKFIVRKILLIFCFLHFAETGLTQEDFRWWNEKHNWDYVTNWHRYIRISPSYMGPNALPVPSVKNGLINRPLHLETAYELHAGHGDQTHNAFTRLYLPFPSKKVALEFSMVPFEYYSMDTTVRDLRRARSFSGNGTAVGDLYISTHIQVLSENETRPGLLLTINLKTASGNKLSDARYTDTPGYFFDLSAGKTFRLSAEKEIDIRPHLMLGFYVWQTYRDAYRQNDGILYGLGADLHLKRLVISNALGGYSGYIGNGDKPLVYRLSVRSNTKGLLEYQFRFQQGLRHFPFSSFRAGIQLNLNKTFKK